MSLPPEDKKEVLLAWEKCGKQQTIRVEGDSMRPLLYHGCGALVEHVSGEIELGDIVVYYQGDVLTIHRVVKIKETNDGIFYRTKGDSCLNIDPSSVKKEEIIGRVVGVVNGDSLVTIDNKRWRRKGRLLARYSYSVGTVIGIAKFFAKPFLKARNSNSETR